MAITLIQTPATHTPCFNDQWFTATSNQTAQPNFQFYVTVTVHYHDGTSYTTAVEPEAINTPPDGILRFNARSYAENYIKNFIQYTSGWSTCTNGVLKMVVNVGERYGAGTPVVYSGANTTYYTWNAGLSFVEESGYSAATYVASVGSTFPILNRYPETRCSNYSKNFLYILADGDNVIQKARVHSDDGVGGLAFFDIANPVVASGNWYDRYLRLNVSPYSLAILGTTNWVAAEGTTYRIDLYDTGGTIRKSVSFTYTTICTKFFRYGMYYLNSYGAFDHCLFEMISEESYTAEKTKVRHTPYYDPTGSGAMSYSASQATSFTYSTAYNKTLKLRTDYITEDQSETLKDLIYSPVAYLDEIEGTYTLFYPVNNADTKYVRNRYFNNKLVTLEANVDLAHTNYKQKGV